MPYIQTAHYLGAHYQVIHPYHVRRLNPVGRPDVTVSRTPITKPAAYDLDLPSLWRVFCARDGSWSQSARVRAGFLSYLRSLVNDPATIDELGCCRDCADPAWEEDLTSGVCESCGENYSNCDECGELHHSDDISETLGESYVCARCRDRYYSWCEECEGYYPDNYANEHDHDDGSACCESPELQFTVRNDGAEPLANDTRISVTLPAGTVSSAGLKAIRDYLRNMSYESGETNLGLYDLACYFTEKVGDQWQAKNGNFSKRLSRYAYQAHRVKLSPEIMSRVGVIARDHSNAVNVEIEVTRDFNQSADYFYHEDSCYWGGYYESRCALKTNGAYGIRSFGDYGGVAGRAWVMPLRQDNSHVEVTGPRSGLGALVPTFRTMDADAFVVFNGYGDLGGYAAARIVAHMAGMTYRKIGFSCDPIYINAGGYLVAPEHIAEPYTDGSLHMSVPQHSSLYESEMSHV